MPNQLSVSIGQFSEAGRKSENQDFHGTLVPNSPQLATKGIVAAVADGISSSQVSRLASEACIRSLVEDYYCTSETWSVKKSAMQVLKANNSWLYSQSQKSEHRFDKDKGYVCTLSALIIKSNTAYTFHLGDSRIYLFRNGCGGLLTSDHRTWVSQQQSYLSRAMGIFPQLELDHDTIELREGDIFVLTTDGVHEHIEQEMMYEFIQQHHSDLHIAAKDIAQHAYGRGSSDNLTVQILRVDSLPAADAGERLNAFNQLAFPPVLHDRAECDGFKILRVLYSSSRSHVYLAENHHQDDVPVVLKAPSIEMKDDPAHLERFLMEEWIARRINSAHVLKPVDVERERKYVFTAFEYIEGQTLTQWMIDHPKPSLQSVREIVEQIGKGLQAFHRLEMLHQDLRPENIMIEYSGLVKIIDFGSTKVAGLNEMTCSTEQQHILGTVQYTAPEYFLGEAGTSRSDLFSLAVITYQMLTGRLPYGTKAAKARTQSAQNKLRYQSVLHDDREIPAWVDDTLKRALHPNPFKRYQTLSEFLFDLSRPSKTFLRKTKAPLIERDPVIFWQVSCAILLLVVVYLLANP